MSKQTDNAKKQLLSLEKEILDEEGIFSVPDVFEYPDVRNAKCMYCGYDIVSDDEGLRVDANGDTIHRGCWQDYAEDNLFELCSPLSFY